MIPTRYLLHASAGDMGFTKTGGIQRVKLWRGEVVMHWVQCVCPDSPIFHTGSVCKQATWSALWGKVLGIGDSYERNDGQLCCCKNALQTTKRLAWYYLKKALQSKQAQEIWSEQGSKHPYFANHTLLSTGAIWPQKPDRVISEDCAHSRISCFLSYGFWRWDSWY